MNFYPCEVSVVVPLYNEEDSLRELSDWVRKVCEKESLSYELILINDGSSDNSWTVIQQLSKEDSRVRGICFSRNYGKSAALDMGFTVAEGRVVITMDADLQDSPDEIPGLYDLIENQGYDLISGWKKKRHDPLTKTIPTKLFNWVTRRFSGIYLHDFNCGLKAYKNKVVKSVELYGEMHRYVPVLAKWNGYKKIGEKIVEHYPRKHGVTKFGIERFLYGFLDLLSVTFITRFRKRPMHFFGGMGFLSFLFGGGVAGWISIQKILGIHTREVVDQPLFFLGLCALIIGMQLFLAGFIAEMMVTTSNKRADYVISDRANC